MTKIATFPGFPGSIPDIGTLPPLHSDTIRVTQSTDLRGTAQFDKSEIVFAGNGFTELVLNSIQFGNGNISDAVAITGDSFRNFVTVHLSNGDTSFSAANWSFQNFIPFDPLQNDQVTVYGSTAADTITGSAMADGLIGGEGNDTLSGLDGRDILIGGEGADILIGGQGDDNYRLDTVHFQSLFPPLETVPFTLTDSKGGPVVPAHLVFDQVVEAADGGIDTVLVRAVGGLDRYTLTGNVENGFVNAPGAFNLTGNALANALTGNDDSNTLSGLDGIDTLKGEGGNDLLIGGRGCDDMDGGSGNDTADYSSALAGVTVSLEESGPQVTGQGTDTLKGIENLAGSIFGDRLTGDSFANILMGDAGADVLTGNGGKDFLIADGGGDRLDGGSGEDRLSGGNGNDVLTGGAGADTFIFAPNSGKDAIADFADTNGAADDVIDIISYGFSSVSQIGKQVSGDDLILVFSPDDTLVLRDYLASHGINAINDDILIA